MVKAIININEHANRVFNVVKAKWDLKDKSEAINLVAEMFEEDILEPELRPEFIKKMNRTQKQKTIKVNNVKEYFKKMRSK